MNKEQLHGELEKAKSKIKCQESQLRKVKLELDFYVKKAKLNLKLHEFWDYTYKKSIEILRQDPLDAAVNANSAVDIYEQKWKQ